MEKESPTEEFRKKIGLADESDAFEPFNYPPLKESVASILRPGV